jgi:thiol-disulfide isomerase/thioredoxin
MGKTAKQTKRERKRAAAEARAAARRRAEQRRRLGLGLGGIALVALVVLGVLASVGGRTGGIGPSNANRVSVEAPPRAEALAPGDAVPGFSAPGLDGGTVAWSDYAGAPTVLSIWAPWCPHCQVELPVLDRVMKDFPGVGFVTVVTAIGDRPGPAPDAYMREHDLTFAAAIDDERGTIAGALGVTGFPTLYFVGSDGTVVRAATGEVDEATLREVIGALS